MASNLDLVRSIFAAWERGDFSSAEWADPKIEHMIVGGPDPVSRTGMDGMAEGFRDWVSAWEDLHIAADEYRELDSGRVLVLLRYIGRGKTSGVDLGGMEATGAGCISRSRRPRDESRDVLGPRPRPRPPRAPGRRAMPTPTDRRSA